MLTCYLQPVMTREVLIYAKDERLKDYITTSLRAHESLSLSPLPCAHAHCAAFSMVPAIQHPAKSRKDILPLVDSLVPQYSL